MKDFIKFVLKQKKPKTAIYGVVNKKTNIELGEIKWYGAWRKYCFFPDGNTVFDTICLAQINDFIEDLMYRKREKDESHTY